MPPFQYTPVTPPGATTAKEGTDQPVKPVEVTPISKSKGAVEEMEEVNMHEVKVEEPKSPPAISEPHDSDVLCGRGGNVNTHAGNAYFRRLVETSKRVYLTARFKREKRLIAESILKDIKRQDPPGRFLLKKGDLWYEIPDEKARDKTSQALREGAPKLREEIQNEMEAKRKQQRESDPPPARNYDSRSEDARRNEEYYRRENEYGRERDQHYPSGNEGYFDYNNIMNTMANTFWCTGNLNDVRDDDRMNGGYNYDNNHPHSNDHHPIRRPDRHPDRHHYQDSSHPSYQAPAYQPSSSHSHWDQSQYGHTSPSQYPSQYSDDSTSRYPDENRSHYREESRSHHYDHIDHSPYNSNDSNSYHGGPPAHRPHHNHQDQPYSRHPATHHPENRHPQSHHVASRPLEKSLWQAFSNSILSLGEGNERNQQQGSRMTSPVDMDMDMDCEPTNLNVEQVYREDSNPDVRTPPPDDEKNKDGYWTPTFEVCNSTAFDLGSCHTNIADIAHWTIYGDQPEKNIQKINSIEIDEPVSPSEMKGSSLVNVFNDSNQSMNVEPMNEGEGDHAVATSGAGASAGRKSDLNASAMNFSKNSILDGSALDLIETPSLDINFSTERDNHYIC